MKVKAVCFHCGKEQSVETDNFSLNTLLNLDGVSKCCDLPNYVYDVEDKNW